jgi:hypothetical protein
LQQTHLVAKKVANQQIQAQNRATPTNKQNTTKPTQTREKPKN